MDDVRGLPPGRAHRCLRSGLDFRQGPPSPPTNGRICTRTSVSIACWIALPLENDLPWSGPRSPNRKAFRHVSFSGMTSWKWHMYLRVTLERDPRPTARAGIGLRLRHGLNSREVGSFRCLARLLQVVTRQDRRSVPRVASKSSTAAQTLSTSSGRVTQPLQPSLGPIHFCARCT